MGWCDDKHVFIWVEYWLWLLLYQLLQRDVEKLRSKSDVGSVQCDMIEPFVEYLNGFGRPPVGYSMKNIRMAAMAIAAEQI